MTTEMGSVLFDLTLNEEQRITRETVQRFAATELRENSRAADEAAQAPDGFYAKSMDLGLAMLSIPEAQGGAGMPRSPISNMLNAEDLGQGDMSLALGALIPMGFVNTVLDQGTEAQINEYLGRFIDEKFRVGTIALMEPRATFDPSDIKTTATLDGSDYILNGVKSMVALGSSAELILVIASVQGDADNKSQAFVVEANAEGISLEDESFMGLRSLALSRMTLENVRVSASAKLGEGDFDLQRLVDLSRIGLCAAAIGTCQAVVDYTKEYCNERVAFGEPISYRQSVAFMIGDMATETEAMKLMLYRAASKAEQGLDFHKEAFLLWTQCSKYCMKVGTDGVQLLGGHGFIREHMVELWYRNLRVVGVLEGCVAV